MTRTVTVGHTSHIYKIGHRRILSRDTCSPGAADAWVFAGRQCERILQLFFFRAVFAKHYMYMRYTHTQRYFTGLGCIFSYPAAPIVPVLLSSLYFPLCLFILQPFPPEHSGSGIEGHKKTKTGNTIEYPATYEEPGIKHASFVFKLWLMRHLSPVSAVQVSLGVAIHLSGHRRLVCRGSLYPILLSQGW